MRDNALLRWALRFLAGFVPLSLAWFLVAPTYSGWIFAVADRWFALDDPVIASLGPWDGRWFVFQLNGQARLPAFELDPFGTFFNVVVLLALMFAVPHLSVRGRLWRAAIAMPALAALHVLFIFVQLKAQLINVGVFVTTGNEAYLYNWAAVFLGGLGQQLFPLLIVAGLTWKAWHPLFARRQELGAKRAAAKAPRGGKPADKSHQFFRFGR